MVRRVLSEAHARHFSRPFFVERTGLAVAARWSPAADATTAPSSLYDVGHPYIKMSRHI
jgi:hypothetical protein